MKRILTILTVLLMGNIGFTQNTHSLQFDGVDDYVMVEDDITLNVDTGSMTLSTWVKKPTTTHSLQTNLIGNYITTTTPTINLMLGGTTTNPGQPLFYVRNTSDEYNLWSTQTIDDNTWYYLTVVKDGDMDSIHLYINGVRDTSLQITNGSNDSGQGFIFGSGHLNRFMEVTMDNVNIWDIPLTQSQIQEHMLCPPTGNETGLVGYWNFEEGTGTITADLTSNSNDGTINGGATWSTDVPQQNCNADTCLAASYPFNGNANDESGNGNDGTVNGATLTTDRFGNANSAYSFDGVDDYVMANPINLTGDFTISTWIVADNDMEYDEVVLNTNSAATILAQGASNSPCNYADYAIGLKGSTSCANPYFEFEAGVGCSFQYYSNCSYSFSNFDNWVNIIYSKVGTDLYRYVDGTLIDIISGVSNLSYDGFPLSIGARSTENCCINGHWKGKIDDIKLFNCGLNQNEVDSLYQSESTMCTVYDTIQVMDTTFVTVYDTTFVTETTYDTVLVSVEDTLNIDVALSLPAPNNVNTILVYPNPAKTNITIDNGNYANMSGYSITITNTISQVMFTGLINQQTFDVDISSWSGGTYFVNIIDSGGLTVDTRQIVKY